MLLFLQQNLFPEIEFIENVQVQNSNLQLKITSIYVIVFILVPFELYMPTDIFQIK